MKKTYDPHSLEQRWYKHWDKQGYFSPKDNDEAYCIVIPPPNITGRLHMGHAFQSTIMDALIRFQRMQGKSTLWQAGTDHAGIATQIVVERLIDAKGKSRHDYGREKFTEEIWEWKKKSGSHITRQLRRMGTSLDWGRERFTMDEGLSKAVKEVFIKLYQEGLIYRGKRLVNWDPILHTAISDLEVLSTEEQGHLWYIRYPIANINKHLVVATTRPETLLGDAAIAVHPDDKRYQHLHDNFVQLPLTGRQIPIIIDDYVDPEFGTGCVKITPAHDFNDYEVWLRHRNTSIIATLPHNGLINIFTSNAEIRKNTPEEGALIPPEYIGLDRTVARKKIIADLNTQGLLEKIVKHKLMVPRGDRSGSVIEPLLTDQWYVKTKPLAQPAIAAVTNGTIRFIPDNWKNTYFNWMHNIQDWCISRQIWWGHRIPAWYDKLGNVYVGHSEKEIRKQHSLQGNIALKQDTDVLDTWFSSALWPFSTLGWPEKTLELKKFYPTSVLVTGFDIIFFWVARMIMLGLKFMGDVPFTEVYIHGLVRDAEGQKMSKSKGNILDPIDVIDGIGLNDLIKKRTTKMMRPHLAAKIEKITRKNFPNGIPAYGTDALRFTFAAMASTGRDIRMDNKRIEGYRNFCNKIWNAGRYVLANTREQNNSSDLKYQYSQADIWITSRLQQVITITTKAIKNYRIDLAAQTLYEFTWNEFCDWYLELTKTTLQQGNAEQQQATRKTLLIVLENILRLLHPLMPFITEEIWQRLTSLMQIEGDTIMLQPYPIANNKLINIKATTEINWLMQFIIGVRNVRSEQKIAPNKPLNILLQAGTASDKINLKNTKNYLLKLGRLERITWLSNEQQAPESAIALVGKMKILIPMEGIIDKKSEIARLEKEIIKIKNNLPRVEGKLNNSNFLDKAPKEVISTAQAKRNKYRLTLQQLEEQLSKIVSNV